MELTKTRKQLPERYTTTVRSLAPTKQLEFSTILAEMVSNRTGASMVRVEEVIQAYGCQIRHLPGISTLPADEAEEQIRKASLAQVMTEIAQVARSYGARVAIPPEVYTECVRLVLDRFAFLSLDEIRISYRMWSAGEIKAKGAEMYGGEFNAAQLGKVLAAYAAHRKPILGNYLRLDGDAKRKTQTDARAKRLKQQFDEQFPLLIEQAIINKISWEEVPAFWYHAALDRGMFEVDIEEMHRTKALAKRMTLIIAKRGEDVAAVLHSTFSPSENSFENRVKVNARKITVYRKLIKNG